MKKSESSGFKELTKNCFFGLLVAGMFVLIVTVATGNKTNNQTVLLTDEPPDILAPVRPGHSNEWGYIDLDGNIVIDAVFDDAECFSEGLAAVKVDKEWGFIDKYAHFVVKPECRNVEQFMNGIALISTSEGVSQINKAGEIMWKFGRSPGIKRYPNGSFSRDNGHGIRLYDGDWSAVSHVELREVTDYAEGFFRVQTGDGRQRYMREDGILLETERNYVKLQPFVNGYAVVENDAGDNSLIDATGKTRIDGTAIGYKLGTVSEDLVSFSVMEGGVQKFGFMNLNGEIVIKSRYAEVNPFRDGVAWVKVIDGYFPYRDSEKWMTTESGYCIIDKTGRIVNPLGFEQPADCHVSSTYVHVSYGTDLNREGLCDLHGNVVIPAVYTSLGGFQYGRSFFKYFSNLYGIIDESGNVICRELGSRYRPFHNVNETRYYSDPRNRSFGMLH